MILKPAWVKACETALLVTGIMTIWTFILTNTNRIHSAYCLTRENRSMTNRTAFPVDYNTVDSYSSVMPWLNISDDVQEMYLLSAYWDTRSAETSPVFISTLAFMRLTNPPNYQFYCSILCDGDVRHAAVQQEHVRSKLGCGAKEFDGDIYWRVVVPCPTAGCQHPERITIGHDEQGVDELTEENSVIVQYPAKEKLHEFGICVPPIFGCLDPGHVIEWMEIQKLLGVSKIVIHNNSQCEDTSRVFHHYARQGLVELRQDHTVLPCDDNKTFGGWHMPMSRLELFLRDPLMLTDCMTRHMYDIENILFIDMDEILVPVTVKSLHQLLDQITETHNMTKDEFYQITFSNFFFLIDDLLIPHPEDQTLPEYMFYLRHRNRLGPSPDNLRPKSLVSGQRCVYVHNHECPSPINEHKLEAKPPHAKIYVSPDIGKVHHYRLNACLRRNGNKISCQDGVSSKPVYADNALLRYRKELLANVQAKRKQLNLDVE